MCRHPSDIETIKLKRKFGLSQSDSVFYLLVVRPLHYFTFDSKCPNVLVPVPTSSNAIHLPNGYFQCDGHREQCFNGESSAFGFSARVHWLGPLVHFWGWFAISNEWLMLREPQRNVWGAPKHVHNDVTLISYGIRIVHTDNVCHRRQRRRHRHSRQHEMYNYFISILNRMRKGALSPYVSI